MISAAADAGVGPDPLAATEAALEGVLGQLGSGAHADLVAVFVGAAHTEQVEAVQRACVEALQPRVLLGATAQGVVAGDTELERPDAIAVWAARLPGATLTPLRFDSPTGPDAAAAWSPVPSAATALILLADPFTFPVPGFLAWARQARPELPVTGGIASGAQTRGAPRLLLDDGVHTDGAVGVAVGGDVGVRHLVSQGCRPVGQSFVVTKAERNVIQELAGGSPADRLREIFAEADDEDRALLQEGLQIGIVIDEYADSYDSGDFLVRGVLGAEPGSGAIAVGDVVRVGQTVRFHVRDARSADEDLRASAERFVEHGQPDAALLFTCNGRGEQLFGVSDHDARLLREVMPDLPLAGFFAAGEIGPVAGRSHLHGFTASMVTFSQG